MAQTTFFDCTNCGPGQDINTGYRTETIVIKYGELKGQESTGPRYFRECAGCGVNINTGGTIRHINHTTHKNGKVTECSDACLSGRIVCDCRCQGRCHGAKTCLCGQEAA